MDHRCHSCVVSPLLSLNGPCPAVRVDDQSCRRVTVRLNVAQPIPVGSVGKYPSGQFSDLPVLGAIGLGVQAACGVFDNDRVAAAEVVVEPLRVRGAEVYAAMANVAFALVGH